MDPGETQRMEPIKVRRRKLADQKAFRICAILALIVAMAGLMMCVTAGGR